MEIICALLLILSLLCGAWLLNRNNRVLKLRLRILDAMKDAADLLDLLDEFESVSYDTMLWSVKPLRPECWYSESFCEKIRRNGFGTLD